MARVAENAVIHPTYAAQTFFLALPQWPNGVCTNKDGTQCLVGGRNLLKIFGIEENRFVEKVNLVTGAKRLNYSTTDVKWHPSEENIIASSAGNGAVIMWDLNKINESKQDHLFTEHYRYVNKICFHPTDPTLLMSCSQDGNMHCFDIRLKKLSETFHGKCDGIRDIQFHPTDKNIFCSASESGNVQLWDMRRPDHHYNQFPAHSGPVFTLNWHPEDYFTLSTGGRDKTIKIWDTQLKTPPTHTIQTIAPVACIKWRPGYKFHIASCALVLDNTVTIWDIRRPFVPFASFEEHKDVATDIIWQKDPDVIISCSRDKVLYNHAIADAERPAEQASQVALSFSANGYIAHAYPEKITQSIQTKQPSQSSYTSQLRTPPVNQIVDFKPVHSNLAWNRINIGGISSSKNGKMNSESLIGTLAKEYKFYGKPFSALCDHNSRVAHLHGLTQKSFTWTILKQLYINEGDTIDKLMGKQMKSRTIDSSNSSSSSLSSYQRRGTSVVTPDMHYNNGSHNINNGSISDDDVGIHTPSSLLQNAKVNDEITMVGPELDEVFGDEDYSKQLFSADLEIEDNDLDCVPDEAIELRLSFGEKARLEDEENTHDMIEKTNSIRPLSLSALDVPEWQFEPLVKEMLYFYAEQGDIQMCVTIMLVLQNRAKDMIDKDEEEEWYNGYLDILYQLHLFNVATEVIKHAPEPVNMLNQNSTTVHMQCESCNKTILSAKHGWYCDNCKKITQNCAICHIPVKGLFSWCQGCGHGGHLSHLKEWYQKYTNCPTGCGHKCEYS